jgi:hypothetical protein
MDGWFCGEGGNTSHRKRGYFKNNKSLPESKGQNFELWVSYLQKLTKGISDLPISL